MAGPHLPAERDRLRDERVPAAPGLGRELSVEPLHEVSASEDRRDDQSGDQPSHHLLSLPRPDTDEDRSGDRTGDGGDLGGQDERHRV